MPPRSRYAVDPSLIAQSQPQQHHQQAGFGQPESAPHYFQPAASFQSQQQPNQPYVNPAGPQLHPVDDRRQPAPTGPYAPTTSANNLAAPRAQSHQHGVTGSGSGRGATYAQAPQEPIHPSYYPPQNHIPPPPHSAGSSIAGPRIQIDPSAMPNPIETQELDQNLYDAEDFQSCDTKGLIPLGVTDWRGIDQGNSLPRYVRPTLPVIPSTSQLLETTALPFALLVQPFASSRYDEAPIPLVSNWVTGESAFDQPRLVEGGDTGPPRCEKCRGYINAWVKWIDGGRRWMCNLCGNHNPVPDMYYSHLSLTGQRMDHESRPELLHGTVDFPVPSMYWAEQPPPNGSLIDIAPDTSAANLAAAGDALVTTGADLLGALQSSLGQAPITRGPSPAPSSQKHRQGAGIGADGPKLRRPQPLGRVFVIDTSVPSVQRGIVREVCEGIKKALYGKGSDEDENDGITAGQKVGIITVGETVGFWDLSIMSAKFRSGKSLHADHQPSFQPALPTPSLLVVSDLDDMFCPLANGFLVDPIEGRSNVEGLLDRLPEMLLNQPDGTRCAIGAAIKGALIGLRSTGGQISFFLSGLPIFGPGKLTPRDNQSVYGTDKERTLFTPNDSFWRTLADEAAEYGVGVNTFLFPEQYTDVASVGAPSTVSGGDIFFHPRFDPVRDRETLHDEILRIVVRETVYNATIRIRCSNGLRVVDHVGSFFQRSLTDLEFGVLDESKAFAAILRHDGSRLDDRQQVYIQIAVLYTSADGSRRVRCLNVCYTVSNLIGNIFRFADLDASVAVFLKNAVSQMSQKSLRDIRKWLNERSIRILASYRRHCAPAVKLGQLILPEAFKLLPLYTLSMQKSKPLKGGNVTSDVRVHYMRALKSLSVPNIMMLLYPRILAIHDLTETTGFAGPNGRLRLPRFMRASHAFMVAEGAYLMCNGESAMIWLGSAVSPKIIDDLYGVDSLQDIDIRMTRLPKLPTLLSTQVRNILSHMERIAGHTLAVLIVRQNMDGLEIEFANQLVEDSNNDGMSYADYLMTVHRAITDDMSGKSSGEGWKAPWS